MKRVLFAVAFVAVVGCSKHEDCLIPRDGEGMFNPRADTFKKAVEQLESHDRALLGAYIYFVRYSGEVIPEGMRIRDAVDLMRSLGQIQYGAF